MNLTRTTGIAAATLTAALALGACGASTATGGGGTPTTAAAPTTAAPAPSSGGGTGDTQQFVTDLQTVASDATQAGQDAQAGDFTATANDCQTFLTDVGTLQSDGTPSGLTADQGTQLSTALNDWAQGGNDCVTGATNEDAATLTAGATLISSGNAIMSNLADAIGG